MVQSWIAGKNANLKFTAKAKITLNKSVNGAGGFDMQPYNGEAVKSLVGSWMQDKAAIDSIDVKDDHVVMSVSGELAFGEFTGKRVLLKKING